MAVIWPVLVVSLIASVVALLVPGWQDLLLLSAPCVLASLVVLLRRSGVLSRAESGKVAGREGSRQHVVVDGSNVMYWDGNTPSLAPVRAVLRDLAAQGFTPGIIFDASAGYKIGDRYKDDDAFARLLDLPEENVLVVPKGTQADGFILDSARKLGARIVTNDRYRDWEQTHPEVRQPGYLIRGGFRDGVLWLELVRDSATT